MENQEPKEQVKKVVKGNKTTEIIIGSAAAKLAQATTNLKQAVEAAGGIIAIVDDSTLKVTNLEMQIADLELEFKQKKAKMAFDLDLEFNKDKDEYVSKYVGSKGLVIVTNDEFSKTQTELTKLKGDLQSEINSKVHAATGALTKEHNNAIMIKDLQHANKEADNNAKINQLMEQNKFLTELPLHF